MFCINRRTGFLHSDVGDEGVDALVLWCTHSTPADEIGEGGDGWQSESKGADGSDSSSC